MTPPRLTVLVVCSKGTYIRSLARDLGAALGCGAHLTRLIRLWVGSFGLADAVSLDEIGAAARSGRPETVLRTADDALASLPALLVPGRARDRPRATAVPGPSPPAPRQSARRACTIPVAGCSGSPSTTVDAASGSPVWR